MAPSLLFAVAILVKQAAGEPQSPEADLVPAAAAQVVETCQSALSTERCRLADGELASGELQATVTFTDSSVFVRLTRSSSGREEAVGKEKSEEVVSERSLDFVEADTVHQRHVAAGLLVAAMSAGAEKEQAEQEQIEPVKPPPPAPVVEPPKRDIPVSRASLATWSVDVGVHASLALTTADPELGGVFSLSHGFTSRLGAALGVELTRSLKDDPRVGSATFLVGPLIALCPGHSALSCWASAQGVFGTTKVSQVGESLDSKSVWRGGARLSLGLAPRWRPVAPFVTLGVTGLGPRVLLTENGSPAGEMPAWYAGTQIGLRFASEFPVLSSH